MGTGESNMKFLGIVLVLAAAGAGVYYFFPDLFVDAPNERTAQDAVADHVEKQSKVIGIDLFQKTDGQERTDEAGVRRYTLEYKCVAKFKKATMWSFIGNRFVTVDPLPEDASKKERKATAGIMAGKSLAKAGDTVMLKGAVEFEHKESGWTVTGVTVGRDR